MCNNIATQAANTPVTSKPTRSVEDMLRDIAFVLRMTRQVKAEMRREQTEVAVEQLQRRATNLEELVAMPV